MGSEMNEVPLHEVSFVDDVAIPIISSADRLVTDVRLVIESALVVFAQHGLELNFSPGKTEALLTRSPQ